MILPNLTHFLIVDYKPTFKLLDGNSRCSMAIASKRIIYHAVYQRVQIALCFCCKFLDSMSVRVKRIGNEVPIKFVGNWLVAVVYCAYVMIAQLHGPCVSRE